MRNSLKIILQIGLLWLIYDACVRFVQWSDFPLPGNVLGIVVLFLLLCSGLIKEEWVSEGASFLLKHFIFFFIPITAGLMGSGDALLRHAVPFAVALLVSSLLPLYAVGHLSQYMQNRSTPLGSGGNKNPVNPAGQAQSEKDAPQGSEPCKK